MTTELIRNCKFAYKCNKKWDDLEATGDAKVRFCQECRQEVFRCLTDDELAQAIRLNHCVAIDGASCRDERSVVAPPRLLGVPGRE